MYPHERKLIASIVFVTLFVATMIWLWLYRQEPEKESSLPTCAEVLYDMHVRVHAPHGVTVSMHCLDDAGQETWIPIGGQGL
jgi:hypothetical protein